MTKIVLTVFVTMTLTIAVGSEVARRSGASVVRTDAMGGRVQLVGAYMPAMADARVLMFELCHRRYEYVELDQAVEFRCAADAEAASSVGSELAMQVTGGGQ
jgi:hypothetical protein